MGRYGGDDEKCEIDSHKIYKNDDDFREKCLLSRYSQKVHIDMYRKELRILKKGSIIYVRGF